MSSYRGTLEGMKPNHADTTHLKRIDGAPPDEYKKGRHGLMFRWSDTCDEWMRTTVSENKLITLSDYKRLIEGWS